MENSNPEISDKELNDLKLDLLSKQKIIAEAEEKQRLSIQKEKLDGTKRILDVLINGDILSLMSHSRTSCNDDAPHNGYNPDTNHARCQKCHIIEVFNDHKKGINEFTAILDLELDFINKE